MNRAYSLFNIKSVDMEARTFSGIASTPSTDRMGDIVEPKGAQFKLPLPLLMQHNSSQPIGWVTSATVTDKGIVVNGQVANIQEEGTLKNRLTESWQMIKAGLVRGLSIGFNALEASDIKGSRWGQRFTKWEWLELSAVTIPANQDASIQAIKSIDATLRAASGRSQQGVVYKSSGASGNFNQRKGSNNMKTIQELREDRDTKMARMGELQATAEAETRDFTPEETLEFDALESEVKELDKDIRKARFDYLNAANAIEVKGASSAFPNRSKQTVIKSPDEKFQGQFYTQMIIARALAHIELMKGNAVPAWKIAEGRFKNHDLLVNILKTGVAGGDETSGAWGAELVAADGRYTGDFITFLTSRTVYDKLPLRQVPANVVIKGQDGTATGYWVGRQQPIPVSKPDFSTVTLEPLKVAAIAALSNELLRDSTPAAEMLVRDSLADASGQRVDNTFLSSDAAVSHVSPAGILNGVSSGTSAGTSAANILTDIKTLYSPFITAKHVSGLQFVLHPSQAKALSLILTSLGTLQFPNITAMGGSLMGDPVVTGDNVDGNDFILLDPSNIWRIGDTGLSVEISREATIEMDTAPTGEGATPTAQSVNMVSMYQAEMTAIKVVRSINFQKRRSTAVSFITNVDYDGTES